MMSGAVGVAIYFSEWLRGQPLAAGALSAVCLGSWVYATYHAWRVEREEVVRLKVAAKPKGSILRLDFQPSDQNCVSYQQGEDKYRVQVFNDGDEKATDVGIALHEVTPGNPHLRGQRFS